jgi:thymidylate synthase
MSEGFPLLTTKKMFFKGIITELLWFLRGDTNIKYLIDKGCHIWDGDCYANYLKESQHEASYTKEEFIDKIKTNNDWAKQWGDLGPIYGAQWRVWLNFRPGGSPLYVDQIKNLINDLKTNPDSRRLMVNAWNVGEISEMVLPPCHYGFQVYTRELSLKERGIIAKSNYYEVSQDIKAFAGMDEDHTLHKQLDDVNIPKRAISLMWNQRSVDTFLGLPFNIASYALLLEILAKTVNMVPEELIGNLGDVHLYSEHIDAAKEQISRTPYELPELRLRDYTTLEELLETKTHTKTCQLWRYDSHPTIKAELKN